MESGEAFALTTPLIKKADGTKFGKSEGGNVWLDPEKTSPYKFYQFWLNAADEDAGGFIKIFSLKGREEIESLIEEHNNAPHERKLQRALAEEVTQRVHSREALENAIQASQMLFGRGTEESLRALDESTLLSVFEGVEQFQVSRDQLTAGIPIIELVAEKCSVFGSKGEARKLIQNNGLSINKTKVDLDKVVGEDDLLNNKLILVQKGKKNYYLVHVS
jgi:tyrosyl-tRNA synthetase